MLRLKIKEAILSRGHVYPLTWLMKHAGFGQTKAFNLLNNKQNSIHIEDMTRLCLLLQCTPNDLMYWKESARQARDIDQPCTLLTSEPLDTVDWLAMLPKLKNDEIENLRKDVLKLLNK